MWEFNNTKSPEDGIQSMKSELVALCDQYAEFNDYCAFFCDACSLFMLANEDTFQSSTHGAHRFSIQLIKRSQYFKERLDYLSQHVVDV